MATGSRGSMAPEIAEYLAEQQSSRAAEQQSSRAHHLAAHDRPACSHHRDPSPAHLHRDRFVPAPSDMTLHPRLMPMCHHRGMAHHTAFVPRRPTSHANVPCPVSPCPLCYSLLSLPRSSATSPVVYPRSRRPGPDTASVSRQSSAPRARRASADVDQPRPFCLSLRFPVQPRRRSSV
jgi:hypothetical protein